MEALPPLEISLTRNLSIGPFQFEKMTVCPACGMAVDGEDKPCPYCGHEFTKGVKFDCPFCGELIPVDSTACPACGIDLSTLPAKARSQPIRIIREAFIADGRIVKPQVAKGSAKRFKCPRCAALLDGTESACPECSQLLVSESGLKCPICSTTVEKRRRKCPKCGFPLGSVRREALEMVPYVPEPTEELPIERETPPVSKPEAETPVKEPEIEPPAPAPQPAVVTQVAKATRQRRIKSEKVTTVDRSSRPSTQGLSNGVSHVNGRGRVNGTGQTNGKGAVNGRAFVNGTGVSNDLGPGGKGSATRRAALATRWQILAVLLVAVLVVPTLIFITTPGKVDKFSIDGKFAEWDGVTTYGARIASSSPSSNIVEWAVASQGSGLFLYFTTEAPMMDSSEAESYYLFVDSDGSNATGYAMGSMGAEYLLRLTGWNSTVNSSSLYEFQSSDRLDWNAWRSSSSLAFALDGTRLEACANLPSPLMEDSRFILMSKDSMERGALSLAAPLKGSLLVVEQVPASDVAVSGLVPKSSSVQVLTLRFTSQGGSGNIVQVNVSMTGATQITQIPQFSLAKDETKAIAIFVDTSAASSGQLVSAEVLASSIVSSYASVDVFGPRVSAYVVSQPATIIIDGAFADWTGRLSQDVDPVRVTNPNVDITAVGNVNASQSSFFYVSVDGEMCSGTYIPATVARPTGTAGGGVIVPARMTAEDIVRVYVDSDASNQTGEPIALDAKQIGADRLIEVRGLFGRITSTKMFDRAPSGWVQTSAEVNAAKDEKRIEIGVTAASLGGGANLEFIVETTSWKGRADLATFDPSSMKAFTRTWVVEPLTASADATSMSYQRKMFYDGVNYWSFYFDGTNTVCKYSLDDGQTWVLSGRVFRSPGVGEVSIWYDSATSTVYAVGDTALATIRVSVQVGKVDPAAHAISWAAKDSGLNTSGYPTPSKNTYICKDANGYLWVLSTNQSTDKPRYYMNAFKSKSADNPDSWTETGQLLPWYVTTDNPKGTIVPAGSGGDVWAVYIYGGYVSGRKYNGTWGADQRIYTLFGSTANTDNSPPSVVVDKKGVVHVVCGSGLRAGGGASTPEIMYYHNNTDATTFTTGVILNSGVPKGVGGYYPTISLDTSTDDLYVMWLQNVLGDATFAPRTLIGKKCVSGTWSNMTIEHQTTFPKQHLTSIYSVSGEFKICWQWTQNTTAPVEVFFDRTVIPEFSDLAIPLCGFLTMIAVYVRISRKKTRS